ncbi:MAG: DNA mismatch repair protein MutL [Chlamydiae bacterium]|nr:DNA mismatch repair protein MutL [Chlamydiota bacterium]
MPQRKIQILSENTINQIAAGEVVENSASVVKELIENALDAGATSIRVETKGGGRSLIEIADNGSGMNEEDLRLSIERHATSKIIQAEDLDSLSTLGFRGEALPTIGSVSQMNLVTAPASGEGRKLILSGGKLEEIAPTSRKQGTTVSVRNLFYNVPARKKFQKSVGWDTSEIHRVLNRIALSNPHLALTWVHEEKTVFSLSGEDQGEKRVAALLGEEFASSLLPISFEEESFSLTGWLGKPTVHRPNRGGGHLFLNGRPVFSHFIARKVLEGYATRLPTGRFPLYLLHLSLPPHLVDVNVHPQKKEVRLRKEAQVGPFLLRAVEKGLSGQRLPPPPPSFSAQPHSYNPIDYPLPKEKTSPSFSPPQVFSEKRHPYETLDLIPKEETSPSFLLPERKMLAKMGKFLLFENEGKIYLLDTVAARHRVSFEQITQKIGNRPIQTLLLPIHLEFGGHEKKLLEESLEQLQEYGIGIRPFGGDTFVVDALPVSLETDELPTLIHHFLEEGTLPPETRLGKALGKLPFRGVSSLEEGKTLVNALFACQEPDVSPSGKPTHTPLTESSLQKLFTIS